MDSRETQAYTVVVNHEGQHSLWLVGKALPQGWKEAGKRGTRDECLGYIDAVWQDMRPLSMRKIESAD